MKICGVYKIENKVNGNIYIGSSKDIDYRWLIHTIKLNTGKHYNKHLQRAWNLYGYNNFEFVIIEECANDLLINREQYFIDNLQPKYNISLNALSPMLGRKHTQETREKMLISQRNRFNNLTPEQWARMSAVQIGNKNCVGRKLSIETREKISAIKMGHFVSSETRLKITGNAFRLGHKHSQETKEKMSNSQKRRFKNKRLLEATK